MLPDAVERKKNIVHSIDKYFLNINFPALIYLLLIL